MVDNPHPPSWWQYEFKAMGSQIILWVDTDDPFAARESFEKVEQLFAVNEQALSRFRPNSELSCLNRQGGEWVNVSDILWRQINLALQLAEATGGRFDPTLLSALESAGYYLSFEEIQNGPLHDVHPIIRSETGRWVEIEVDDKKQAVRLPLGVRIDLGGVAKGDTAQQAIDVLEAVGPCLVDAGGDIVAGPAPRNFPGWPVGISSPLINFMTENEDLFTVWLARATLASSGIDFRRWQTGGIWKHHLIDPLTGEPAKTDGLTVTVLAKEAAIAEGWATASLVAGSSMGMNALSEQSLAGLMVTQDGRILATSEMDRFLQNQIPLVEIP